jgi:hypothetical protein
MKAHSRIILGPGIIFVAVLIAGLWYLKRHTKDAMAFATGVDVTNFGEIDKKKKEQNEINSLSGGSRMRDEEKIKIY